MRHRRWVVVLAVVIVGLVPLGFLGVRVGSRHPAVKRAVLSRIMPNVEGQLSIGELDIGLASLHIGDVVIDLEEAGSVYVPSATVNVSYRRFLAGGLEAQRALGSVILNGPRVRVVYGGGQPDTSGQFDPARLAELLPDYVGVSDGTVVFEDAATGRSAFVSSIDLLLERQEDGAIEGRVVASCLGGTGNLTADLAWDVVAQTLTAEGALEDAVLSRGLPLPESVPLDPVEGEIDATFLANSGSGSGSLEIDFALSGGVMEILDFGERLTDVEGEGRFDGDVLDFTRLEGHWRDAEWSAAGAFCISACDLRGVTGRAVGVPLTPLVEIVGGTPFELEGTVDVDLLIRGTLDDPVVGIEAESRELVVDGVPVSNVRAAGELAGDVIEVHSARAEALGGTFDLRGTVGRAAEGEPWDVEAGGDVVGLDLSTLSELLTWGTAEGSLDLLDFEAEGTTERLDVESIMRWRDLAVGAVGIGDGAGGVLMRDGSLTVSLGAADGTFSLNGEVTDLFADPVVGAELVLSALPVDSLLGSKEGSVLQATLDGALRLEGSPADLAVEGNVVVEGTHSKATLGVTGGYRETTEGPDLALSVRSEDAAVRGVRVPFTADLAYDGERIVFDSADIGGVGEAHASVGLTGERPLLASLVVSEADLRDIITMVSGAEPPEGLAGLAFASVSVHGTLEELESSVQLQIGDAEFAGVTDLDAALLAVLRDGDLAIDEFTVTHGGRTIASADGSADLDGDIMLSVRGEGIPGPILGGGAESRFDMTMGIGGETRDPNFDARISASDGEFAGIPFDEFSARITGAGGLARVDPLALERSGIYRLSASGRVPYGEPEGGEEPGEGSLTIDVDGDPLALLFELASLGRSEGGEGRLSAHLVWEGGEVAVASARLDARADRAAPVALFDEIEDVEVRAEILDGAVAEAMVTGLVSGNRITLGSRRGVTLEGRLVPSLHMGGIDLGVLTLTTDPEGVEAAIPELMPPGDVGRITVRGQDGAPEAFIAGPDDHPLVWGELEYNDMSFTYPFEDTEEEGALGFIETADLALRMSAGRNVWYRRTDASLRLERGSSLYFRGVPAEGGDLCVEGHVESTHGTVTYANSDFDVRLASVDFPPFCEPPRFFVEADTKVQDGTTITLKMDTIEAALPLAPAPGAPLDESALQLTSDAPEDNTREKVLSRLTYGVSYDLLEGGEQAALERREAIDVIGGQIAGVVMRPILAPIEARMRRNLHLDLVRIDVDFIQHFISKVDGWSAQSSSSTYVPFLGDSRLLLGKYFAEDWLISYVGRVDSYNAAVGDQQLAVKQEFGLEYEVSRNTSLSLRVVYDPTWPGWERRITIENRYLF
jgi:hypothetical protein